jgi:hypothetical protein
MQTNAIQDIGVTAVCMAHRLLKPGRAGVAASAYLHKFKRINHLV